MVVINTMTASCISVPNANPFNDKYHYSPIVITTSEDNESSEAYNNACIGPSSVYNSHKDNMTAMTNGISGTPGAPIIEISRSPSKQDKPLNNNINHPPQQNTQGIYREKESSQHTARGVYVN